MTEPGYILVCDESDKVGEFYSNFYGGVRVGVTKYQSVSERLQHKRDELGLTGEIKWSETNVSVGSRYCEMMGAFFDEMEAGNLVMRVMFTQNSFVPQNLTKTHILDQYYILYYQFLKHAFGLCYMPAHRKKPVFQIFLDEIAEKYEQRAKFRGFIAALPSNELIRNSIILRPEDITHVHSHQHIILQCLDVVLGSISFRLNDKHKKIPDGQRRRGKRTIQKEILYKCILSHIKRVTQKPHFNIGSTTSLSIFPDGTWADPYLHWLFVPSNRKYDSSKTKR